MVAALKCKHSERLNVFPNAKWKNGKSNLFVPHMDERTNFL